MMENEETVTPTKENGTERRPFLLTLLLVFSMTYFLLLSALFLLSLFYSGRITYIINEYIPERPVSSFTLYMIILLGAATHLAGSAGLFLLFRMKRKGYYLFSASALVIAVYQLLQYSISPLSTAFYVLQVIIFGLFIKKLK